MKQILLLSPFYQWGSQNSEILGSLLKVSQLVSVRPGIWTQAADFRACASHHILFCLPILILRSLHQTGQASVSYLATVILTSRIFFSHFSSVKCSHAPTCSMSMSIYICLMRSDTLLYPGPHWSVCLGRLFQSQGLFVQALRSGIWSISLSMQSNRSLSSLFVWFLSGLDIFYPGKTWIYW